MNEENKQEQVEKVEKQESAEPKEQLKYTDADVNAIIDRKFAKWKAEQEEEANEAKRLAKMNAEQKAQHERDKLQARIDELEREKTMSEMNGIARNMLAEAQISAKDELIKHLVSDNADDTKTAVESFILLFNEHLETAVTERLKGKTPKHISSSNAALTKQQILAVKDRSERLRLIEENPGLFN